MKELKMKCPTCKEETEIIKIISDSERNVQTITYFLSCGHKFVSLEVTEIILLDEFVQVERCNWEGSLLSKYRTKKSGSTKKSARETIEIDHKNKTYHHIVEEQQENCEWKIVHKH